MAQGLLLTGLIVLHKLRRGLMNISHSSKETFQIAFQLHWESKYLKLILRDEKE